MEDSGERRNNNEQAQTRSNPGLALAAGPSNSPRVSIHPQRTIRTSSRTTPIQPPLHQTLNRTIGRNQRASRPPPPPRSQPYPSFHPPQGAASHTGSAAPADQHMENVLQTIGRPHTTLFGAGGDYPVCLTQSKPDSWDHMTMMKIDPTSLSTYIGEQEALELRLGSAPSIFPNLVRTPFGDILCSKVFLNLRLWGRLVGIEFNKDIKITIHVIPACHGPVPFTIGWTRINILRGENPGFDDLCQRVGIAAEMQRLELTGRKPVPIHGSGRTSTPASSLQVPQHQGLGYGHASSSSDSQQPAAHHMAAPSNHHIPGGSSACSSATQSTAPSFEEQARRNQWQSSPQHIPGLAPGPLSVQAPETSLEYPSFGEPSGGSFWAFPGGGIPNHGPGGGQGSGPLGGAGPSRRL